MVCDAVLSAIPNVQNVKGAVVKWEKLVPPIQVVSVVCLFAFSHTLRFEKDTPMTTPSPYAGESKLLHLPAEIALVRRPRDTGYSTSCILVGPHDPIDQIVVVATT